MGIMKTITYTTSPTFRLSFPDFSSVKFPKLSFVKLNKILPKKVSHTLGSFWTVFTYQV